MATAPGEAGPSLSIRHGFRCVPEGGTTIEEILLAVGEQIGHDQITSASRMNKAVVVFVKSELPVNRVVEIGLVVNDIFLPVTPLFSPTDRITISNVPPFIPNVDIQREVTCFGKMASGIKEVNLGCKSESLKHVLSFRRQVFMFLDSPSHTLDVSFRVKHEGLSYMIYASTGSLRCFECGSFGHKRASCPSINTDQNKEKAGPSYEETGSETEKGNDPQTTDAATTSAGESSGMGHPKVGAFLAETRGVVEDVAKRNGYSGPAAANEGIQVDGVLEVEELRGQTGDLNVVALPAPEEDKSAHGEVEGAEGKPGGSKEHGPVVCGKGENELEMQDPDEGQSDESSMSDIGTQSQVGDGDEVDLYTLKEVDAFLDTTYNRRITVSEFFPDENKFIASVTALQKKVGYDVLPQQKRYRLKKLVAKVRKERRGRKGTKK